MQKPRTDERASDLTYHLMQIDDALAEIEGGISVLMRLSEEKEFTPFAYVAAKLHDDHEKALTAFQAAWAHRAKTPALAKARGETADV